MLNEKLIKAVCHVFHEYGYEKIEDKIQLLKDLKHEAEDIKRKQDIKNEEEWKEFHNAT